MLVLSRREDQQILFPNLNIRLQVLQVKGRVVKLGIDAPRDITILRPEACSEVDLAATVSQSADGFDSHRLRNHLNTIRLGLALFQKQTEAGMDDDAQLTMQQVTDQLHKLDAEVAESKQKIQSATQARPVRLMIVEDDDNERELLAGLLRLHGFEVAVAPNGVEAFNALQTSELPDYVLLDMNMPIGNGPSTLSGIRADQRMANLKVIAVSGTAPEELGVPADSLEGWFPKPLDPERLISRIASETRSLVSAS